MHVWTFQVLHMLSFAIPKHKMQLYEKLDKIYVSFDFDLNIRNTDYFSSCSFPGFTEGAPMFFLEAEFCSPQRGQLCGLKEVAEITALGSCWNVRRNPQRLFFFQVRVAGVIEQIHCSATDIDVLSLSCGLWHRLISYCNRNAAPTNTLNTVYCGRSKKQTPTSQDYSVKWVTFLILKYFTKSWLNLPEKCSHVSPVRSTSFQWGSHSPHTLKRTSGHSAQWWKRGPAGSVIF